MEHGKFLLAALLSNFFVYPAVNSAAANPKIEMLEPSSLQRQAVEALRRVDRTPYQVLEERYEKAKEPDDKDFKGWRTGRCFFNDRPSQPVAALLTSDTMSENGPAFSDASNRKLIPLIARTEKPTYFDKLTPNKLKEVSSAKLRYRDDVSFPVRTNASVFSTVSRTMTTQARNYEFRKSARYLVMKAVCTDHGGCYSDHENDRLLFYEDDTVAYCYFFTDAKRP